MEGINLLIGTPLLGCRPHALLEFLVLDYYNIPIAFRVRGAGVGVISQPNSCQLIATATGSDIGKTTGMATPYTTRLKHTYICQILNKNY